MDEDAVAMPECEWLDEKLGEELKCLAEELEGGGKISVVDFVRMVEFRREIYGDAERVAPVVEWRDGVDRAA